jgi:hypothetical protein
MSPVDPAPFPASPTAWEEAGGAPVAPEAARVERRVEDELTRLLYRAAGFGLASNLALAALLAIGTWGEVAHRVTVGWLVNPMGSGRNGARLEPSAARRDGRGGSG